MEGKDLKNYNSQKEYGHIRDISETWQDKEKLVNALDAARHEIEDCGDAIFREHPETISFIFNSTGRLLMNLSDHFYQYFPEGSSFDEDLKTFFQL